MLVLWCASTFVRLLYIILCLSWKRGLTNRGFKLKNAQYTMSYLLYDHHSRKEIGTYHCDSIL